MTFVALLARRAAVVATQHRISHRLVATRLVSSSSSTSSPSSDKPFSYAVDKSDVQAAAAAASHGTDRMSSTHGMGVYTEIESDDVETLINNFTAPALARALREREATLHTAAHLAQTKNYAELTRVLQPFLKTSVEQRRIGKTDWDTSRGFTRRELAKIQRQLHRMPREVFQAATKRASVVIPLCNVDGVASVLFERRSMVVRTHKHEVCFPGGMVDKQDGTIIETSLREMQEELGIPPEKTEVLGVLRCNWDEVSNMTGIAVTPVVGFIGRVVHRQSLRRPTLVSSIDLSLRVDISPRNLSHSSTSSLLLLNPLTPPPHMLNLSYQANLKIFNSTSKPTRTRSKRCSAYPWSSY